MRTLLDDLDREFAHLHQRTCRLVERVPAGRLYLRPGDRSALSVGENILRSAAAVEQTFGGITSTLWDDPLEWTLPEHLVTPEKVLAYLNEVEATRKRGFSFFTSDAELSREIPAPEVPTRIGALLVGTLARAAHFQGRAFAVLAALDGDAAASEPGGSA
jgi:hypothetical protein